MPPEMQFGFMMRTVVMRFTMTTTIINHVCSSDPQAAQQERLVFLLAYNFLVAAFGRS